MRHFLLSCSCLVLCIGLATACQSSKDSVSDPIQTASKAQGPQSGAEGVHTSEDGVTLTVGNAADGRPQIASGEIVSIYGATFQQGDQVVLTYTDANGPEQAQAQVLFVEDHQINALLPTLDITVNQATLKVLDSSQALVGSASLTLYAVQPGIFTYDQSGTGLPAGIITTTHLDHSQTTETISPSTVLNWDDDTLDVSMTFFVTGGVAPGCAPDIAQTNLVFSVPDTTWPYIFPIWPYAPSYVGSDSAKDLGVQQVNVSLTPLMTGSYWLVQGQVPTGPRQYLNPVSNLTGMTFMAQLNTCDPTFLPSKGININSWPDSLQLPLPPFGNLPQLQCPADDLYKVYFCQNSGFNPNTGCLICNDP